MFPIPADLLGPYIGSNVAAVLLVLTAWRWPKVTRYVFAFIFFAASIANAIMVVTQPSLYVDGYGELALLGLYRDFIYGVFSLYTIPMVLAVALGQLTVSVLLLSRHYFHLGVLGGVVFLLAIAPLGVGSALPASVIMAVALALVFMKLRVAGVQPQQSTRRVMG